MKKYELTNESKKYCGRTLYRIRACRDFTTVDGSTVKAGDKGGWVEKKRNLSQHGNAWIFDNSIACDKSKVYGNAILCGCTDVFDKVKVRGNATLCDATVYGKSVVCDTATIYRGMVHGGVKIHGNNFVGEGTEIY